MKPPVRPCIERLPDGRGCPEYALPGKPRCAQHHAQAAKTGQRSPGTTAAWRKARAAALARAHDMCQKCGRTEAQAKAAGTWLEVHHRSGAGVRAKTHDPDDLEVLCRTPCHVDTLGAKTRPTLAEYQEQIVARARARGRP